MNAAQLKLVQNCSHFASGQQRQGLDRLCPDNHRHYDGMCYQVRIAKYVCSILIEVHKELRLLIIVILITL